MIGKDVGPFDFESIMLYSSYSFAKDIGEPVMIRNSNKQPFSPWYKLSAGDIWN